jgi:RsiW-degrading membrane proteinase PrsW (M82 family)
LGFGLALALSFVSAFLCACLLYWMDRYEKEPKRLLVGVFVWGAVFATLASGVAQLVLQGFTWGITGSAPIADLATASLFAPVTEEVLKACAVFGVFALMRHEFDSTLDGVVYAGTVALGFAATENTLYLYSGYLADGGEALLQLFLARIVFGIWNHPLYTSFFGVALALARLSRSRLVWLTAPAGGLLVGMAVHSLHNTLATIRGGDLVVVALLLDWSGWAFLAVVAIFAARSEGRLVARELTEEAGRGLLSPGQVRTAASSLRRSVLLLSSVGRGRFWATRSFYQACAELAHKKRQLRCAGEEQGNSRRISDLRLSIKRLGRGVAP